MTLERLQYEDAMALLTLTPIAEHKHSVVQSDCVSTYGVYLIYMEHKYVIATCYKSRENSFANQFEWHQ